MVDKYVHSLSPENGIFIIITIIIYLICQKDRVAPNGIY